MDLNKDIKMNNEMLKLKSSEEFKNKFKHLWDAVPTNIMFGHINYIGTNINALLHVLLTNPDAKFALWKSGTKLEDDSVYLILDNESDCILFMTKYDNEIWNAVYELKEKIISLIPSEYNKNISLIHSCITKPYDSCAVTNTTSASDTSHKTKLTVFDGEDGIQGSIRALILSEWITYGSKFTNEVDIALQTSLLQHFWGCCDYIKSEWY